MALELGGNPMQKIRILVVDNDQVLLDLIKSILEHFGFGKIATTTDGRKALSMMRTKKYDLVLSDCEMPTMDGLSFVKFLRTNPDSPDCFVPIIMITGKAERKDIEAARDIGVTEFLAKPFSVEDLRKRIISIFEQPRDFIFNNHYIGPSRRRRNRPFEGSDKRHNS